jgi:hypothetical protein
MSFRLSAKAVALAVMTSVMLVGGLSYAGYSDHSNVSVTATTMQGTFYGARHSSRSTDYIRCFVTGYGGQVQMGCGAVANGVGKFCTSYNPSLVQAASALTAYSSVYVAFNASSECTQLSVYDGSMYLN